MEALNVKMGFERGCLAPWERVAGTRHSLKEAVRVGDEGFGGGEGEEKCLRKWSMAQNWGYRAEKMDALRNDRKMGGAMQAFAGGERCIWKYCVISPVTLTSHFLEVSTNCPQIYGSLFLEDLAAENWILLAEWHVRSNNYLKDQKTVFPSFKYVTDFGVWYPVTDFFLWSVSFRKEMLNTVVPSVKGQALLLAHCAMEASFQCWQTDSESPTGLSDVRLVTKAACSPARSVLPDQDHRLCSGLQAPQQYLVENFELFNPQAASLWWQVFKRWERHVILSP